MYGCSRWCALAVTVAIAGCGGGGAGEVDASNGRIDAAMSDGGPRADVGPGVDGGPGSDTGPGVDGGPGSDASMGVDAWMASDGGGLGPVVNTACSATPADFPAFIDCSFCAPTLSVNVCLDASGCHVTNDYRIGAPLEPTQCAAADRMFRMSSTGGGGGSMPFGWPGSNWTARWATNGVTRGVPISTPIDTDLSAIVERMSDHVLYRIDFRISATSVHVTSVRLWTDPIPAYGASWDCASLPQTFAAPASGIETYANVCVDAPPYPSCVVAGDFDATPEMEACRGPEVMGFGVDMATGMPWATANVGSPTRYLLVSASAGTISPTDPQRVTDLPVGVDVTYVVMGDTATYTVVARWTGSAFIVQSLAIG